MTLQPPDLVAARVDVEDPHWLLSVTAVRDWPLNAHGKPMDQPTGRTIGDWLTGGHPPGLLHHAFRGLAPPVIDPALAAVVVDALVPPAWHEEAALTVVEHLAACAIRATGRPVEFGFQLGPGPAPQFFLRIAPPAVLHPHGVVARPVGPFTVRNGRIGLRTLSPLPPEPGIMTLGGIDENGR